MTDEMAILVQANPDEGIVDVDLNAKGFSPVEVLAIIHKLEQRAMEEAMEFWDAQQNLDEAMDDGGD